MQTYHITTPKNAAFSEAVSIIDLLKDRGFEAFIVGGSVRDLILRRSVSDFDLATSATPDQVTEITKQLFKVLPTGIEHGTVSLVGKNGQYEVTTFRKDVATDGRRAKVQFGSSLKEDAQRRDFTINALYLDAAGAVIDVVGGWQDLQSQRLRFVGDAHERIKEDYLRALRLLRFWSQLGLKPMKKDLCAVELSFKNLKRLSRERIVVEVRKLVEGEHFMPAFAYFLTKKLTYYLWTLRLSSSDTNLIKAALRKTSKPLRWKVFLSILVKGKTTRRVNNFLCELKVSSSDRDVVCRVMEVHREISRKKFAKAEYLLGIIDQAEKNRSAGFFTDEVLPILEAIVFSTNMQKRVRFLKNLERRFQVLRLETQRLDTAQFMREKNLLPGPKLGKELAKELLRRRKNGLVMS